MSPKAPRRTAERVRLAALALFNRFGEPQVSTNHIAAELSISPGNLHYHYPAKDGLVNTLYDEYALALSRLLPAAAEVRDLEDAWFFIHSLTERIWDYRFLYRDLNLLLARNRHLEAGMRQTLLAQTQALRALLAGLQAGGVLALDDTAASDIATRQVMLLSYWLSYEYALDPRHAMEPEALQGAVLRGCAHALGLLLPYLPAGQQSHMRQLLRAYDNPTTHDHE